MISRRTLGPAIAAVVCIGVAGCGATTDKAGGRQAGHPLVLHVLNTRSAGEVQPFVDKLTAVSKGMLQLKVEDKWERGSPTADADVIGAIQAGAADLGIDAARAWRGVGVTSFDALVAPMAIDSMALQEKVLAGNLPGEMLPALTPLGLDGMGILPGPMHKPGGITRTLLSPADYKGARMGVGASVVVDRAVRTLGAVPVASGFEGADLRPFDGVEQQASSIAGDQYDDVVGTITDNVHLWPRPMVIFGSVESMHRLSALQLGWLRSAARDSLDAETTAQMRTDTDDIQAMCRRGKTRFVDATAAQLAQLRTAFAPVYAWLDQNEQTRRFLDQIAELRTGVTPYPQETLSCAGETPASTLPAAPATPLDGTYRMVSTQQDGKSDPDFQFPENWGTFIYVLTRGRFAFTQENAAACTWGYGTYTVTGHRTAWTFIDGGGIAPSGAANKPGEHFEFTWSSYRDTVTFGPVPGAISPNGFYLEPWHRLDSKPAPSHLSARCPPPATALTG